MKKFVWLFQHLVPLNGKHFCQLAELLNGSLKSVFVFLRLRVALTVFLVKISRRYLGQCYLNTYKLLGVLVC